eukprot:11556681-Heterocapsa_arctica.AAC.1
MVFGVGGASVSVGHDGLIVDIRGGLVQVQWSAYVHFLGQPACGFERLGVLPVKLVLGLCSEQFVILPTFVVGPADVPSVILVFLG